MIKLPALLAELNALRAQLNKAPLKGWKESTAEIKKAIAKAKQIVASREAIEEHAEKEATPAVSNSQAKDLKRIKKGTKKTDKAEGASDAKIDRFAGMNPKVARAKLRKMFGSEWSTKTAQEIADALKVKKS